MSRFHNVNWKHKNIQKDTSKPITKKVENNQKIEKPSSSDNAKDVDKKEIPHYVYYKPASKDHGSCWFIKDHPKLGARNIKTKNSRTSVRRVNAERSINKNFGRRSIDVIK